MNDIYKILNEGPGSPGETSRVIVSDFLKRERKLNIPIKNIYKNMLLDYSNTYSNMGLTYLDKIMIERVVEKSKGNLLYIIFVDILVTNYNQFTNNMETLMSNFDIIFDIVFTNYSNLYPYEITGDKDFLKNELYVFLKNEMKLIKF